MSPQPQAGDRGRDTRGGRLPGSSNSLRLRTYGDRKRTATQSSSACWPLPVGPALHHPATKRMRAIGTGAGQSMTSIPAGAYVCWSAAFTATSRSRLPSTSDARNEPQSARIWSFGRDCGGAKRKRVLREQQFPRRSRKSPIVISTLGVDDHYLRANNSSRMTNEEGASHGLSR